MKKFAIVFLSCIGCAHAVMDFPSEDAAPAKKDAGTLKPDAGQQQQDASMQMEEDTWSPPDTGPSCTLGITYGGAQCDSCMQNSCCSQDNACVKNNDCTSLITCMNNCQNDPDPNACMNNCANAHQTGMQLLGNIDQCMQSSCSNACR